MKRSIVPALVLAAACAGVAHAQNNKMIYTVQDCPEEGGFITRTEIWDALPDTEERLVCVMGVDCRGKAWSTCGMLVTGNTAIATLNGAYNSAVSGDNARFAAGDEQNHITEIIIRDGVAHVRADRHVYYKVFSIAKGTVVFDDPRLARAGTMVALATSGSTSGPHLAVAYDHQSNQVVGYRMYLR